MCLQAAGLFACKKGYGLPTARIYMGLETRERGEKMELKVFRDSLSSMGSLCETKAELPVEAEILIPDYLPQVFKIIKCFVYLVPLQKQITAGRLTVDGYLRCVVYYQAEEDQSLCQTEQKLPFTRAMDLPEGDYSGYSVQVGGQLEYLNCRAVNQRRVDLRGAYALSARVACRTDQEVITALADCGIEQRMESVEGAKCLASLDKMITAEEQLQFAQPPQAILDVAGVGQVEEVKLISGKAVVKGAIQVSLLYRTGPGYQMEQTQQRVPFNQILDLEGVPEDSECFASAELTGCTVMAAAQEGGHTITATAALHLRVWRKNECYLVSDAFSTRFKTQVSSQRILTEQLFQTLAQECEAQTGGALPDEEAQIIHCFVLPGLPELTAVGQGVQLTGRASAHVFCMNSLGEIDCYDKSFEYTLNPPWPGSPEEYRCECWPTVTDIDVRKNGAEMTLSARIRLDGLVFKRSWQTALEQVECGEALEQPEPDIALRIYYAAPGEDVFEIAKRYHVSPAAMLKSNQLEDTRITQAARLLVPASM